MSWNWEYVVVYGAERLGRESPGNNQVMYTTWGDAEDLSKQVDKGEN